MSKHRETKKPISKKVEAKIEQLERRKGIRALPKRILIVCEDNKSAPNYFRALKKEFGLSATSMEVVGSGGRTQPIQIVKMALELKKRAAGKNSGTEPFGHVWCIIDGDYGNKIKNARSKANAHTIKLAISTKCFEYWVLLHFEENDKSSLNCRELESRLKRDHIHKYEKGNYDFSDIVKNVRIASERAKRLRIPGIKRSELPEVQNPCSEIYLLIDEILSH